VKNINLEVSLKPYFGLDAAGLRASCKDVLRQWATLLHQAESISVMFWASDGSEILDYRGDLDQEMEWAYFIGNANGHLFPPVPGDEDRKHLHSRSYLYREDAAPITYRRFAEIIRIWRETLSTYGKPARIGLTFDPGGEFAPSDFKYARHREICMADTMGKASFVCCYARLNGDDVAYAGFPDGIPHNTSLGTFLGRQFNCLARDLDFDFLWFSNGFGFGLETWKTIGPLFDGTHFFPEKAAETRDQILAFWQDYRKECPALGIMTRGTNLGTGTDLSSDATPLRELYEGGFNFEPPPNSPWAALNGDFGLEIAGFMTRIAELPPGQDALFRFYTHDPWWLNSPWLDRYERQAHDIYLPLAVARVTADGITEPPQKLSFLSIDDSYGQMPDIVPNEVTPHIMRAWEERPDAPGPFVWLYPFDEIHDAMFGPDPCPERLFHTDWFVREILNDGVPLNTVISTRAWRALGDKRRALFEGRIIITPAPFDEAGETTLLEWADQGGHLLVYGPLDRAPRLLERLGLLAAESLEGVMQVSSTLPGLDAVHTKEATIYTHQNVMSGGGLREAFIHPSSVSLASAFCGEKTRALAAEYRTPSGGSIMWLRGPLPMQLKPNTHLPLRDDPACTFPLAGLARRFLLSRNWHLAFDAESHTQRRPVLTIHRQAGAYWFSGYQPDTTVEIGLSTPDGAPLMSGCETQLRNGIAKYRLPRAWRHECRVFVQQNVDGVLSCREETSVAMGVRRRFAVNGLRNANLVFYPETNPDLEPFRIQIMEGYHGAGPEIPHDNRSDGSCVINDVSGSVLISW